MRQVIADFKYKNQSRFDGLTLSEGGSHLDFGIHKLVQRGDALA